MAETITLRAYLNDLNEMLERGGSAEVVSHCRYILQRFPQNIDTYRLLAQALLQRGHNEGTSSYFNEAAEVFQRVLSVVPNDYVAHFGLSEIRAQDGELDRAIWHMERAYEQLPGNQVLQDALRELYGKRDGEEHAPAKIQLTRGALARQYVNGQLYDQALIELRNALHQDANRIDLEVMLAETLWESQHPVEAGEAAVRILKKLPNSLAANRILARLWLENERPADAQRFLERLEALDPYLAADVLQPDTEVYDTITIDRLDYNAQAQAALSQETPDWVQELGGMEMGNVFSLDEPIASDEAGVSEESPETVQFDAEVPDWFAGVDSNLGATAPDTVDADADAMPWDSADWLTGGADQLTSNSPAQFQDEEASPADIPDWFIDSIGPEPEPASSSPRAATPLDADWLLGDDEAPTFGEAEANADDFAAMFDDLQTETPAASDPDLADLDADWLMDGADEGSDFATMFTADDDADQLDESTASESASITSDWLSDEEADQLVDYATMFDAIQTNDQPDEPVESADRLSGDTDDASDFAAMFTADDDVDQPDEADALEPAATADWLFGNDDEVSDFAAMFDAAADSEQPAEADTFEPAATADWLVGDEVSDFATMFDTADETEQPDEAAVSESADWLADDVDEVSDFAAMFDAAADSEQPDEADTFEPAATADWLAGDEVSDFATMFETADETEQPDEAAVSESADWLADDVDEVSDFAAMFDAAADSEQPDESAVSESAGWLADDVDEDRETVLPSSLFDEVETDEDTEAVLESFDDILSAASSDDESLSGFTDLLAEAHDSQAISRVLVDEIADSEDLMPPEWVATFEADDEAEDERQAVAVTDSDHVEDSYDEIAQIVSQAEIEADDAKALDFDVAEVDQPEATFFAIGDEGEFFAVSDDTDQGMVLDWLQSSQEPTSQEPVEDQLDFAADDQEVDEVDDQADEWLSAIPDLELESVPDEADEMIPFAAELPDQELPDFMAEPFDQDEVAEDDRIADMAFDELEPVETMATEESEGQAEIDEPYDSFDGGRAEDVPEYESAPETGILQPDEAPDWMLALTGQLSPDMVDTFESDQIDDEDESESLLSVLGFEIEPIDEVAADEELSSAVADSLEDMALDETESGADEESEKPFDLDQLAPPAEEEGAMPDWLAAITGTTQVDDLDFGAADMAESLSPDDELEWLTPTGDAFAQAGDTFDDDEVLAALGQIGDTLGTSELDDTVLDDDVALEDPFAKFDFDGITNKAAEPAVETAPSTDESLAEMFAEFDFGEAEPEMQAVAADDSAAELADDLFAEFDFGEVAENFGTEVAQLDDLAHTNIGDADQSETDMAFDFEDEASDTSSTGEFSFGDLTPRWLRKPKDAFEDDETD